MIINVHAHVFTLRTILSREAVRVMTQRLRDKGLPDFFVEAVEGFLDDLLDKPEARLPSSGLNRRAWSGGIELGQGR